MDTKNSTKFVIFKLYQLQSSESCVDKKAGTFKQWRGKLDGADCDKLFTLFYVCFAILLESKRTEWM